MAAVDPSDTFVDKLKRTAYRVFLNIHLKYDVYVYRGGFSRDFHDQVVLRAKEYNNLGFVTMELGKNESSQIVAKSIMFQGDKSKLEHKGTIEGCLEDFAVLAMDILISMGRYALVGNNCQNFCNKFLEKVGLEDGQYMTTAKKAAIGTAVGVGVTLGGLLVAGLYGAWNSEQSSDSKKKKKHNHDALV
jgi:hypothetical protein